ncbi:MULTISPECIES: hypothetical protein [Streptomyces]|uniref:Uncharacterized protein n=1 Tax=Streptomyces clavifer TaxID=68188 RepID=A0ABS4VHU4_9ACTN|nr:MULTISPECIES: hypothetical protein [Streptomyces]MBP2363356.1 hypothetical protein [Streptomyces clavifer]MDX2748502.1 hypothetical protein [Streptomyces sp. NRRL_B-2557]GHB30859.1 hypothetical protein GCM10010392_68610 [Streptomyces clavifer]
MARLPRTTVPPRYSTALPLLAGHGHRVVDTRSGYTLTERPDADAARLAAEEFNTSPRAAVNAVRALDEAQSGPAAHVLRSLRRYGYQWALEQREAVTLHSYHELAGLIEAGHLAMVWSIQGRPFYVTPERFRDLPTVFLEEDTGNEFPSVPESELDRRRARLEAMPSKERYSPCELHGINTGKCAICRPVEEWQCDWGTCWANAVTRIEGRQMCERCAPSMDSRLYLRER